MHELGIVFHMRDLLEDVAREQGLVRIEKVVVDLGEVSLPCVTIAVARMARSLMVARVRTAVVCIPSCCVVTRC